MRIFSNKKWKQLKREHNKLVDDYEFLWDENRKLKLKLEEKEHRTMTMPSFIPKYWQMNITKKHERTIKRWEKEVRQEMNGVLDRFGQKQDDGKIGIELIYYK